MSLTLRSAACWLIFACQPPGPTAAEALAPWPRAPEALAARCAAEPAPELAPACWVQLAATWAARGDAARADQACSQIVADGPATATWKEECAFRTGEELARSGAALPALERCARAGWFGRSCLMHASQSLPPSPGLDSRRPPAELAAAAAELDQQVQIALNGAAHGIPGEGRDLLRARFGFNVYVGSGVAEPGPARLPGELGPALRTGFAIEAVRLGVAAGEDPHPRLALEVWTGARPAPTGPPLAAEHRAGRYLQRGPTQAESGLPHTPVFGGGLRLVGRDAEEDLLIAALEAMFFLPDTPAAALRPWMDDPAERVRWTAARLTRRASTPAEAEALAAAVAASPDAGLRAAWAAGAP